MTSSLPSPDPAAVLALLALSLSTVGSVSTTSSWGWVATKVLGTLPSRMNWRSGLPRAPGHIAPARWSPYYDRSPSTTWTLGSTAFEALVTRPVTKIFCAEAAPPPRRSARANAEVLSSYTL